MAKPRADQVVRSLGGQRSSIKRLQAMDTVAIQTALQKTRSVPFPVQNKTGAGIQKKKLPKLYVIDTNVFMNDPTSLFSFEEHHVAILSIILEELDNNKEGKGDPARNARQTSRFLDGIFTSCEKTEINTGVSLLSASKGLASGCIFMYECPDSGSKKADNIIIQTVIALSEKFKDKKYSDVILVSRDINMRLKARSIGVEVEDYLTDKTIEDSDVLPSGIVELDSTFLSKIQNLESWKKDGHSFYKASPRFKLSKIDISTNNFITDGNNNYQVISMGSEGIVLRTLTDYSIKKHEVFGINARNLEQNYLLNLLMNRDIDFICALGLAGTGKTLLTLAAALMQTMEAKIFTEIIYTRVTVPVGEDIGFLPGTEEDKMLPWAGALLDNLEVLVPTIEENTKKDGNHRPSQTPSGWNHAATMDLLRTKIKVKAINFMRGRTFQNKFLIVDEAQNLTPKQMKTLITRAGPGTKIVCLGNLAQIDTPYLTEGSSGLTYVVERFKGWPHSGHITLQKGERSRLADYANEML